MKQIKIVDTDNPHLLRLISALDKELNETYGEAMQDYNPLNTLSTVSLALVLYQDGEPVACGCYRKVDQQTIEIKRMFVTPSKRAQGYAKEILSRLEAAALENGFTSAILETGNLQHRAMRLYESMGYRKIPNYGHYAGLPASVCYRKDLTTG